MKSAKGSFGSEFRVGMVVFFISSKTEQVIPALVSEKITRSTLDCEVKVTYVLKVKAGKGFKEIEVDPLKVDLFEDTEDVRSFMMQRTATAIDALIEAAMSAASVLSPTQKKNEPSPDLQPEVNLDAIDPDAPAEVVLPDGTVAKLRM